MRFRISVSGRGFGDGVEVVQLEVEGRRFLIEKERERE